MSVRDFNADTTLRSSDDVLFKVYKKQLETHSGAFAGAEEFICIPGEELQVTESSEVLEILLQFMSLQCPPDLTKLEFSVLAPLAEAVEKYQVFSAMQRFIQGGNHCAPGGSSGTCSEA